MYSSVRFSFKMVRVQIFFWKAGVTLTIVHTIILFFLDQTFKNYSAQVPMCSLSTQGPVVQNKIKLTHD